MITTAANDVVQPFHDRMPVIPVILPRESYQPVEKGNLAVEGMLNPLEFRG